MSLRLALPPLALVLGLSAVTIAILPDDSRRNPRPALAVVQKIDCSTSMRGVLAPLREQAGAITDDGARPRSLLAAGTFAGPPGRSDTPWTVVDRYRLDLDATQGNATKALERIRAQGRRNAAAIQALFTCPDGYRGGSPLLSALADCATLLGDADLPAGTQRRVLLYTDAAIVGDGLDARRGITAEQADAAVARFTHRLAGLRGASIRVVGAGTGTDVDSDTFQTIRNLLARVIDKVGGRLVSFGPTPAGYPAAFA